MVKTPLSVREEGMLMESSGEEDSISIPSSLTESEIESVSEYDGSEDETSDSETTSDSRERRRN